MMPSPMFPKRQADDFADALATLDEGPRMQWLSYFFEALEEEIGTNALAEAHSLLEDRIEGGGW